MIDYHTIKRVIQRNFFKLSNPSWTERTRGTTGREKYIYPFDDRLEEDKLVVAEHPSEYFSSMAKGIGGEQAEDLTEEDFIEHSSLHLISTYLEESNEPFCFRPE